MTNPCPPDCEFRADSYTAGKPCPFHQHGQWVETLDTRPTQAEVEAKATEMFGPGWKEPFEHQKATLDRRLAERLDAARAAVIAQRRAATANCPFCGGPDRPGHDCS